MSTITKTVVKIANTEEVSELKGAHEASDVQSNFAAFFPYITNCTFTVKEEDGVRYITFAEKLGTKGA